MRLARSGCRCGGAQQPIVGVQEQGPPVLRGGAPLAQRAGAADSASYFPAGTASGHPTARLRV